MADLRIGIIGAGAIADFHIKAYLGNDKVEIAAICDLNENLAKEKASKYGIPCCYTDYNEIFKDESIDAVSIVTPTFTHKNLVIEALKWGKHVLCEKPPAKNYEEAEEIKKAAEESGKLVMFAFVCRFDTNIRYLKEKIDAGEMGEIYYAEASRLDRACTIRGWFVDKEKSGGGALIDGAIHEIDLALYLMGYPEVESVKGFATDVNTNLPYSLKNAGDSWPSADLATYKRNVESMASGYVKFKNGACLYVKASWVLNTIRTGRLLEIHGTKAGAEYKQGKMSILSIENDYLVESAPVAGSGVIPFDAEIGHFVDCILNGTECICTPAQGAEIMKIISAIYESAETGKEIVF